MDFRGEGFGENGVASILTLDKQGWHLEDVNCDVIQSDVMTLS